MSDESYIKLIATGNNDAFEKLYRIYSDKVFNTLLSYTKNEEDAQELLQDVFITIYKSAPAFQFKSSVSTWIYRITVNKSLDFLRKKNVGKRRGIFTSLYIKNSVEVKYEMSHFEHPGVELQNMENAKLIFQAIDVLNEKQKTAFILTQIEGLPQKEVAEIMNLSRKSIESLVQRAKANLREELRTYFPDRGN